MKVFKVTYVDHTSDYYVADGWPEIAEWAKQLPDDSKLLSIENTINNVNKIDPYVCNRQETKEAHGA